MIPPACRSSQSGKRAAIAVGPASRARVCSPEGAGDPLDRFFEFLRGAERDFLAGLDLDLLAGGGITAHARGALAYHKNAEPADADALALLEVLHDIADQSAENC